MFQNEKDKNKGQRGEVELEESNQKVYFPGGSEVKASAYNVGDLGSIPGSGSFLEKEMATHSSTLAQKIPWMEEPGVHGVTKSWT